MDMDLNNRLTEDETLEQAYDIFLELAADNLDPADIILFNLQFEERGGWKGTYGGVSWFTDECDCNFLRYF